MNEDSIQNFTTAQLEELDVCIQECGNNQGNLIPLLEKVQLLLGYIPLSVQQRIADKTGIPANQIYGVVTFYSFFSMKAKARHRIQICLGTACYVKGGKEIAEKILKDLGIANYGESTKDGRFTYEKARCFGSCGLAPVMVIDGKIYGKVTLESVDEILAQYK
jgi:NADH:ubiquinone oxidoreductase subunit E